METDNKLLEWAIELQSLAQAGLTYGKDVFDRERYQRIREISAEMLAEKSGLPVEKVRDLFCANRDIKRQSWIHGPQSSRTTGSYW